MLDSKHDIEQLKDHNADSVLHPASQVKSVHDRNLRIINNAEGVYITDINGNQQIDAVGGLWCVNIGYGRSEIGKVMAQSAEKLGYYHTFGGASNVEQIKLAQALLKLAPPSLGKVFFGSSGSDANDTLVKIVWHYNLLRGKPNKKKIIARENAYHGTSLSTASLTGLGSFHSNFGLPLDFAKHTKVPFYYRDHSEGESEQAYVERLVHALEALIAKEGADNIGAFIAEPIMGAGGVITPPNGYFEAIQVVLKKHDILFIADEVVSGYGRTGEWFASPSMGIKPDMMATAKGLTSGYFPMSAAFISNEIWQVLRDDGQSVGSFAHGYTYSGHPIGAAVAIRNLEIIENEGLVQKAKENGEYFHSALSEALSIHPNVGEIRGKGLLVGIQLVEDKATRRFFDPALAKAAQVANEAHKLGVIVRPLPSITTLALSPPLTITREEIDIVVEVLTRSINRVFAR